MNRLKAKKSLYILVHLIVPLANFIISVILGAFFTSKSSLAYYGFSI
ncbi:hypothetical protein [Bacillus gaemokensis]|nr:hypothetical protein [Bacillus gaemokensis]